jgi:class 3 adenylate cyclase
MGFQQFILAILTGCSLVFGLYYLFAAIFIHKKLFDKYVYFFVMCIGWSFYIFFGLLLSLPYSIEDYLLFHRLKILSGIILVPFIFIFLYSSYFKQGKKYIPYFCFITSPLFLFTIPYDFFLSLPIKTIVIETPISTFTYHISKINVYYSIWAFELLISSITSLLYFLFSKKSDKNYQYLVIMILFIICPFNDFLVTHGYLKSILIDEYGLFIVIAFVFIDFIKEDRKTYLKVIELNKESERRLKLMEIYTRKSLVSEIEKGNDPTKFEPQNIQIATLFSDIRDFTGISEGLKPLEVVEMLNAYFNRMNATIIKHNGEIDKLMGDCIMALFKNPDDALKSAIEMRMELARFNEVEERYSISGRYGISRRINNGIGLNFGEVIIGNIGSESKMDYTVVGDIVNTASRLEALTKYYKVPLIISEDLKVQLKSRKMDSTSEVESISQYHIRFLDEVLVKGKSNPMKIYEVFDFEPHEIIEVKEGNVSALAEAFKYYQQGEFLKAIEIYSKMNSTSEVESISNSDPVLYFFSERCKNLQIQKDAGLLKEWNGVFEFMDK